MSEARLCYIRNNIAFFTTQAIEDQWGDDWNDAPYEHNAGDPYDWWEGSEKPRYEIIRVHFEAPMETPANKAWSGNSRYSVDEINAKHVAWLAPNNEIKWAEPIFAGVTIDEFMRLIWKAGGNIYKRVNPE